MLGSAKPRRLRVSWIFLALSLTLALLLPGSGLAEHTIRIDASGTGHVDSYCEHTPGRDDGIGPTRAGAGIGANSGNDSSPGILEAETFAGIGETDNDQTFTVATPTNGTELANASVSSSAKIQPVGTGPPIDGPGAHKVCIAPPTSHGPWGRILDEH